MWISFIIHLLSNLTKKDLDHCTMFDHKSVWLPSVWLPWLPSVWVPSVWVPSVWVPSVWVPSIWLPSVWNLPSGVVYGCYCCHGCLVYGCQVYGCHGCRSL